MKNYMNMLKLHNCNCANTKIRLNYLEQSVKIVKMSKIVLFLVILSVGENAGEEAAGFHYKISERFF